MASSFPTSLDVFTNPASTDLMNSVTVPHNEQHANANDAIEALQAKVGVDSSAVTTSLDYRVATLESSGAGMETSSTAPSSPSDGDMWYDTDDGRAYVYYDDGSSQQWVEFGAPPVQHGKILQVVEGSQATRVTIASTSYTDTNLTATITPTAATSKVLVIVSQSFAVFRSTNDIIRGQMKLLRDATDLQEYAAGVVSAGSDVAGNLVVGSQQTYTYLDSPSSTSALVYKTQAKCHTTANNGRIFANGDDISSLASYITLIEVAA